MLKTEQDLIQLVQEDDWMMDVLHKAKTLRLPDWWVCAGFVRSKIWDTLHGFMERTPIPDVDVIYFDPSNLDENKEKEFEDKLKELAPDVPWSVKNEARMHIVNHIPPYMSSIDAISKFPETASALGLTLDDQDNVILAAPWGVEDVLQLVVKPTPHFKETKERVTVYENRIVTKNWKSIWNKLNIYHIEQ